MHKDIWTDFSPYGLGLLTNKPKGMCLLTSPVFTGVSTALITPFRDGKIDLDSTYNLISMQKIAGIAALTVCGTTGEAATMTDTERSTLIRFTVDNSQGMKIIAGTGTNDTRAALYRSQAAEANGADALLIVTPYYNKPTQSGLIKHYTYIADRVEIPVIMYNVPSRTGVSLSPETLQILSGHPNINGLKEASGDITRLSSIFNLCGDSLNVWSGNDDMTVPMMSLGAKGVISVASNIIPEVMTEIAALCLNGSFHQASELQTKYIDLMRILFVETNPIPVKEAAYQMGLCENEMRLPLCGMGKDNLAKLNEALRRFRLI